MPETTAAPLVWVMQKPRSALEELNLPFVPIVIWVSRHVVTACQ